MKTISLDQNWTFRWGYLDSVGGLDNDAGVQVKIADAVDESEMLVCPECGMLNPKGSEYCLDCGAEL